MVDIEKLKLVKKIAAILVCLLLLIVGFLLGSTIGKKEPKQVKIEPNESVDKEAKKELTTKIVNDFLTAYYTKKDVGENRNRYEPLVSVAMFNELKAQEEQPINQAYKGYIVNQVFDRADIYVDTIKSTAVCLVNYTYTHRSEKNTDRNALLNQNESEAIKIEFQKEGKKFIVNKIDYVSLTEIDSGGYNNYKIELNDTPQFSTSDSNSTEEVISSNDKTITTTEETNNVEEN
ncbi:MAG: hypothetical protein RR812_04575 [Vagococcus sp.]